MNGGGRGRGAMFRQFPQQRDRKEWVREGGRGGGPGGMGGRGREREGCWGGGEDGR